MAQSEQKLRSSGQATMFDLFGQTAPVPMPSLELTGGEVSAKEKLTWEKELMGVYLSEHPFARYSKLIDTENTTLPSQINAELNGQTITLVGMVDSVRELTTSKDHKPFCSAMVGDDVAALEVMVWPRIFEDTRDLWKDGNFLLIEGKVKIKEERVQVACDAAEVYEPGTKPKPAMVLPNHSPSTTAQANGNFKNGNGHNGNGHDGNGHNGNGKAANGSSNKPSVAPPELYRLTITLRETENEEQDEIKLNQLYDLLREYRGRDEVILQIIEEECVKNLRAGVNVEYSADFQKRLSIMVGPENLKVEKLG
jgi:DNA polymerase-3 subunit alpha